MTVADVDEGPVLDGPDEQLWRNCNPAWFLDGDRLSSQVFRPTPKDAGKLSIARSARVSAADHQAEFTAGGLGSVGVWAVTVAEVDAQGLRAVHDEHGPHAPVPCPRGHGFLDFRGLGGGAVRRVAAGLRDRAAARGRVHPPPGAPVT